LLLYNIIRTNSIKTKNKYNNGHKFLLAHLALPIIVMAKNFQEIVTQ